MAKNKYYVVWKGLNPGVYANWAECKMQGEGQEGAKYKSFETREEAVEAFEKGYTHYLKTASSAKAAANLETIKRSSNNVLDFLDSESYFRYTADFSISSKDLYEIYKLWCEDNACHPVSTARLSSEVSQNAVRLNLEPTNNIYLPGGRRVRGFMGIEALVHPAA